MEKTAKGNRLARGERLQIMLDEHELRAVDDFRFTHRMPSRAAAVRELLRRGLAAEGWTVGKPGATSKTLGVVASVPKSNLKTG
jgi:metal-responsive CopG/Arc/MetJ family transcriptional regulator